MTCCTIRGIDVSFPYEPYQVQEDYMNKVIECLQLGVNGMLESPTGTGKTLSLLCSSLAWLESKKAQQQLTILQHASGEDYKNNLNRLRSEINASVGLWNTANNFMLPRIIYTSRTHTQLSQAINELKNCHYKHVRAVVLGSRDQLCLHPEVSKVQNHSSKVYMCRSKISSKSCPFHLNVEEKILSQREYEQTTVMDIEDLITLGKKYTCCPYYAAKTLKAKSDIMFTPYNYVIDPKTRRVQGIELESNVIIFDEAHNIEGACEDSMSVQLRSLDLAFCINEISQTISMIKDFENDQSSFSLSPESSAPDFTLTDLSILKVMFCELEEHLDKVLSDGPPEGIAKSGDYMIDLLAKIELTPQRRDVVLDLLDKIILYHMAAAVVSPWSSKGSGLQKFSDMLKILFAKVANGAETCDLRKELSLKYRVYLQYEASKSQNSSDSWTTLASNNKKSWKLDCWCLSPGTAMQDLLRHGTHSIILTSGTLSPLPPLISELGISFPVQLENPHIINDKQVFIGVIPQGPDNTTLNSSYQNRFSEKYISSLGRTVTNLCRLIPDGVLVFFPSYSLMRGNISKWEETGVWQNLSGIKPVFVEPQGKDAFQESIDQFYLKINDPNSKGAALLAVCRGKVSEGVDFTDKNARAVIITGLPFLPSMDPRVKMKMSYLNAVAKETKGLSGQEWYVLQASRAVNQAIGRVIRHKNDYGAILLCDNRFAEKRIQSQLSKWVQGRIKNFDTFGPALRYLSSFFKELDQNPCSRRTPLSSRNSAGSLNTAFTFSSSTAGMKQSTNMNSAVDNKVHKNSNDSVLFQEYVTSTKASAETSNSFVSNVNGKSIFDAMDACTTTSSITEEQRNNAPSPNTHALQIPKASTSTPVNSKEAKRRKINIKLRQADVQEDNQATRQNDREIWKKYLLEVKTLLGLSEMYGKFCASVKEFRTTKDTEKFATEMKEIFAHIPERKKYLQKTSLLINSQERTKFLILSCGITSS